MTTDLVLLDTDLKELLADTLGQKEFNTVMTVLAGENKEPSPKLAGLPTFPLSNWPDTVQTIRFSVTYNEKTVIWDWTAVNAMIDLCNQAETTRGSYAIRKAKGIAFKPEDLNPVLAVTQGKTVIYSKFPGMSDGGKKTVATLEARKLSALEAAQVDSILADYEPSCATAIRAEIANIHLAEAKAKAEAKPEAGKGKTEGETETKK